MCNASPHKQLWGRRKSRPLNASRAQAMEHIFPTLEIPESQRNGQGQTPPDTLFPRHTKHCEFWMEIGFGAGEHIIGLLEQTPDISILAAEPFVNGMASFVKDLPSTLHNRVRVIMDDGLHLVNMTKDNSISRLYILNPDPWHKKRHHKRRIINPENLDKFARILKPGGQLILSSDVPDLVDWMVTHTSRHPAFSWTAEHVQDWTTPPANWIPTRYETKGAKGAHKQCYLLFSRK